MIYIFAFLTLSLSYIALDQPGSRDDLNGTLKMENPVLIKHWDKLKENTLIGFSNERIYRQMSISQKDTTISNPNYDPELAQKLGGDDYGMKSYVLVILKTGTNQTTDRTFINESFRGHMENINRLVDDGKLTVAGPLGQNDNTYRGIFILNVTTFEEAERLLQNDAAIKEGLLDYDLYNWYGSAALPEYLDASDKIWRIQP